MTIKDIIYMLGTWPLTLQRDALWDEDIDWWSKYYASTGELDKCKKYLDLGYDKMQVGEFLSRKVS